MSRKFPGDSRGQVTLGMTGSQQSTQSRGAHTQRDPGLVLCYHCSETLNNFILERVFGK